MSDTEGNLPFEGRRNYPIHSENNSGMQQAKKDGERGEGYLPGMSYKMDNYTF